jgi:hypothetical protein
MSAKTSSWRTMFLLAALFNYAIGLSIVLAPRWSYGLSWVPPIGPSGAMTLKFWFDFGAVVALIGVGYHIVSRDPSRNRGIVWLGIVSKIFDVATLTYRFGLGLGRPLVLIPAAIDGTFVILFLLFLRRSRTVARA